MAKERECNALEQGLVSLCMTEQGNCFRDLGRFDEAVSAYEEGIRLDEQRGAIRDVAVGKGQIGYIRELQGRYQEALAAYVEGQERFTRLGEPRMIALAQQDIGNVYRRVGQLEAAEDAYRNALAIMVQLRDIAGQASVLGVLGLLYSEYLHRPEEAVVFHRQAVDKSVEIGDVAKEGLRRSNLAITWWKLRRFDEARQEIRRALECKTQFGHASELWKSWTILAYIETDAGNPAAAADAKGKAIACYLTYRRDGGENHEANGRIALSVTQSMLSGDQAKAVSFLQQLASHPNATGGLGAFIHALQAIVAGSRNRSLAGALELDFMMAAEILFLIETLENHR